MLNSLQTSSNTYGGAELFVAKHRTQAPAAHWDDEWRFQNSTNVRWEIENEFLCGENTIKVESGSFQNALVVMGLVDENNENERHEPIILHNELQSP